MERSVKGRLKTLEASLEAQIAEMRADISDKDLLKAAKSGSSLGFVKTAEEYRRDRELTLNSLLNIPQTKPFTSQCDSMSNELKIASLPSYTPNNLPLLLHQFYCDRVEHLVHLKHIYLLRWARFAVGQPKITEELHDQFQERMRLLMMEYNDALNRAKRLSLSCDCLLAEKASPTSLLEVDDVVIYIQWLVYHLHTVKSTSGFLMSLQWLPLLHYKELAKSIGVKMQEGSARKKSQLPKAFAATTTTTTTTGGGGGVDGGDSGTQTRWMQGKSFTSVINSVIRRESLGNPVPTSEKHSDKKKGEPKLAMLASALINMGLTTTQVASKSLPHHTVDMRKLESVMQDLMATYSIVGPSTFHSQPEELQLYYQVMRKFQTIFRRQEQSTSLHTYDRLPPNGENGSAKRSKSKLLFRKPSNWVKFVKVNPTPDPIQISSYAKIRQQVADVDPLLKLSSHCTHLHNIQRVLYALRQHCIAVKHPSPITPLSVPAHKTSHDTMLIWKCIYSGLDSRNPLGTEEDDTGMDFSDAESSGAGKVGGASKGKDPINKEEVKFDVPDAMKLINNPGGRRVSSKAHSSAKDAYFGFLLLRHLKIRDMRNKCLSILNYFRSVECTITINSEGLSLESPHEQHCSAPSGLLDHRHLFNTPADYIIDQTEFMQFMEVENHDDFYSFDGEGHVKVWDQSGATIVYDVALEDLKHLEEELLVLGSYFIASCLLKDMKARRNNDRHGVLGSQDINLELYSQKAVDRFAVLLDLWTNEAQFLEAKMRVINCYLECYHNVCDKRERNKLAEIITTYLYSRPRHDPGASYFTDIYKSEVTCLHTQCQLLQAVINHQLTTERSYNQKISSRECKVSSSSFNGGTTTTTNATLLQSIASYGVPYSLIPKQLVSLSGDKKLLIHSHLLEVSNSLCVVSLIPQAMEWSLNEAAARQGVTSPDSIVKLHCKLSELALQEWKHGTEMGTSYTNEIQKQLFADVCVEDPRLLAELCVTNGNRVVAGEETRSNPSELRKKRIQAWTDVLQLISVRHHLLVACSECETLSRLYKQQLLTLEVEECHAYLRCVPFDLSLHLPGDKDLNHFVSQSREGKGEDSRLDRYTPSQQSLAIQELDDKHVGTFSFRSRGGIDKILSSLNGLESITTTLQCQLAHRNTLAVACLQNFIIIKQILAATIKTSPSIQDSNKDAASSKSKLSSASFKSSTPPTVTPPTTIPPKGSQEYQTIMFIKRLKKNFVSLQQEKAPVRDHMLAQFVKQPSSVVRSSDDLVKVKCKLISSYSTNLMQVMATYSLRAQIMRQYDTILELLNGFPSARDTHFTMGKPLDLSINGGRGVRSGSGNSSSASSRKISMDLQLSLGGGKNHRQHLSRVFALLNKDGTKILNMWYIPHYTEILTMFSSLSMESCNNALSNILSVVAPLHTLLQYMCAYVRVGGVSKRHTHQGETDYRKEFGGTWGGTEGIGSELLQLQSEISRLDEPKSPSQVAEYLSLRCNVVYLQHDVTVRHYLRRTLLITDNMSAVKTLDSVSIPSLQRLSINSIPHHISYPLLTHLPTPLNLINKNTSDLIPWRHFLSTSSLFPAALDHWWSVGSFVFSSLACFNDTARSLAHGEFLGVSLLLEDILQSSDLAHTDNIPISQDESSTFALSQAPGQPPRTPTIHPPHTPTLHPPHTPTLHPPQTPTLHPPQTPTLHPPHTPISHFPHTHTSRPTTPHPPPPTPTPITTLTTLHVQVPPLEGTRHLETFLLKTSQMEKLKVEWGLKTLSVYSISDRRLAKLLEDSYRDKVLSWAKKMVVKLHQKEVQRIQTELENDSVSTTTFITETSAADTAGTGESLESTEVHQNELQLREYQITKLLELLAQQMIQDTCKRLAKQHHLMLNERERDEATLPLDLWKTSAMNFKEITGLPRSHVVEHFVSLLQSRMVEQEDKVVLSKTDLQECLHVLSSGVLAREKECYHMYASYYEALLRSQYNQLYQKSRDIEHYQWLVDTLDEQSREESLSFVGDQVQSLILEVTGLRTKVADLHQQLSQQADQVYKHAQQQYSELVDSLFSATVSVKNRFEDYRGQLYSDVTSSLYEVRQSVAENVSKMKERLGLQDTEDPTEEVNTIATTLKAEGMKDIQVENAQLNKMVVRMRTMNKWNKYKNDVASNEKLLALQSELNEAHKRLLILKMEDEEEIQSLQHQVQSLHKSVSRSERECEMMRHTLQEERQKKATLSKSSLKSQDTHLSKTEKSYTAKLDQLKQELDERERQLQSLTSDLTTAQRQNDSEKSRNTKTLRTMHNQLHHERNLKLDAFHEVDKLLTQVQDSEHHNQAALRSSLYSVARTAPLAMASAPRLSTGAGLKTDMQLLKSKRPKSQQQRSRSSLMSQPAPPTGAERIDLTQEILALKLI